MPYLNSLPRVFFSLIVILALAACDPSSSPEQPSSVTAVEIESLDDGNSPEANCDLATLECEITAANGYFGIKPRVIGTGTFNSDVTFSFSNPIARCNLGEDPNYCTVNPISPAQSGTTILTVSSEQDPSKTAQVSISINLPGSPTDSVTAVEIESLDDENSPEANCDLATLECEITADSGFFGVNPRVVGEGSFNSDVTFSFSNPIAKCNLEGDSNYCTVSSIIPAQSGTTILTVASVQDPSITAQVSITINLP